MKTSLFLVYLALLVLLALTTASAYLKLGDFNGILNILIAIGKTALILAFFMRVRFSKTPTLLFSLAGFAWLGFLVALTMSDYLTRGALLIYGK